MHEFGRGTGEDMASDSSLGALLEAARLRSGLTLKALSEATGIPLTSLHRLFHDRVNRPSPAHIVAIADVLKTARGPLLAAAGYPESGSDADLDTALRATYPLPDAAIAEMHEAITAVAARFRNVTATGGSR
ncbi:transcriptional regulator with XRE-family HTH domain [Catenulispora sp. GAS73]|uniref:helix-turn-helix domain-containing protein n=1 Tax=Catenulispora sp. GAS73 TaxID=3156269 RepID=UPI0035184998